MAKNVINSFNAGELSPYLYARTDLDKYSSGCLVMENFMPLPYGGATRRPAIEYKFDADDKMRLIPFTFSVTDTYLLTIGDAEIKIYQDTTLKDTVVAPWADTELDEIKYVQSADVMWLVHPDYPPQRLSRNSDTDWTLAEETFDVPPLLDENVEDIYFDFTFSETAWNTTPGTAYAVGDIVEFDNVVYRCIYAHNSNASFSVDHSNGYWFPSNAGSSATLNSYDATTGSTDAAYFTADMVGQQFKVRSQRNTTQFQSINTSAPYVAEFTESTTELRQSIVAGDYYTSPINVSFSNWSYTGNLVGSASSVVTIQKSNDYGVTWKDYVRVMNEPSLTVKAVEFSSDIEEPANTWLRMKCFTIGTSGGGTLDHTLTTDNPDIIGYIEITGYTDAHTVTVDIVYDIQQELSAGIAGSLKPGQGTSGSDALAPYRSNDWTEVAFSDDNGYPCCVALFENRFVYAGTTGSPDRMWLSKVDDYQNFQTSDADDGGLDLTLNSGQIDEIRWMVPQDKLVIGTAGGEWSLGASDERKPITPTGFDLKRKTSYGSNIVQGILVNSAVLFLMRQSRKVREWPTTFNAQDYIAPDLSILAEHITDGGVSQWSYQQQPDNVLWSIRGDGTLLGFTYERDQNVTGWHRHSNDNFTFESIAVLPRDNEEDEIWVSVNMGGTRMIGKLCDREWGTTLASEWMGSDLWVDYQSSGDALHLANKTVEWVRDGVPQGTQTVDGSGNIVGTLGTVNIVGLPFTSTLAPMYLVLENKYGTSKGDKSDSQMATIRFKDTYSAKVGQTEDDLEDVKFDPDETALYSEDAEVWYSNASEFLQTCYIVQDEPMPCTVLCAIVRQEV